MLNLMGDLNLFHFLKICDEGFNRIKKVIFSLNKPPKKKYISSYLFR